MISIRPSIRLSLTLLFLPILSSALIPGNLAVLRTTGNTSKASSAISIIEYTTSGSLVSTINLPATGSNPIQTAGVFGGSEGFLTTSTDKKFLVVAGYGTSNTYSDITLTSASSVPRIIGTVGPSGNYVQAGSSAVFYSANDIRGGVSDGINFWAAGASIANIDGINYFGPGTAVGLATGIVPPKAYGLRIFNGKIFYSTQKAGPSNSTSQLGIFSCGSGLPVSGPVTVSQIINTGTALPQDFSFNAAEDVCYIAIGSNTAAGGIQKWTKTGSTWGLAYTLSTGATNIGAYGLIVDYSGAAPILYATTYESTGNRIIRITDNGPASTASTLVAAASGTFYKGISFSPEDSGPRSITLSVSADTVLEAGNGTVTISAVASSNLAQSGTIGLNISGSGITTGDYSLSDTVISIPAGSSSGSIILTAINDQFVEGDETLSVSLGTLSQGLIAGVQSSRNIVIRDNNNNTPPSIVFNTALTSNEIDGGKNSVTSPYKTSAVLNDSIDPLRINGITFSINDAETAFNRLIFSVISSDTNVIPLNGLIWSAASGIGTLKIRPAAVGYSTITVSVSDSIAIRSFQLNYAVSDGLPEYIPSKTYWHTGMSDGSACIPLASDFYVAGDDELNVLNVYPRYSSGLPVKSFEYTNYLNLPNPSSPEVDVECGTRSRNSVSRTYWSGSMSNGKLPYDNKPNRDRLFAMDITKTADSTQFSFAGYVNIRPYLLAWGDSMGYNFSASAAAGINSKALAGFSLEGMTFGPDNTTLYLGLRAPLVPTSFRHNAVIAPLLNFESWFNNGNPVSPPSFGAPIELDLDYRGIRDIIRLADGAFIIIAGSPIEDGGVNNIYKWSGYPQDSPISIANGFGGVLNLEGVMQVYDSTGNISSTKLQFVSDGGAFVLYGDNLQAKDFAELNLRKFRSDLTEGLDLSLCSGFNANIVPGGNINWCGRDTIVFSADSTIGTAYVWSNGNTTNRISITHPGSYSVTISNSRSGCSATSSPSIVIRSMPTDIDEDGKTDNQDFLLLLGRYNQSCSGCLEDVNGDQLVDNYDFLLLLGSYNRSCR